MNILRRWHQAAAPIGSFPPLTKQVPALPAVANLVQLAAQSCRAAKSRPAGNLPFTSHMGTLQARALVCARLHNTHRPWPPAGLGCCNA